MKSAVRTPEGGCTAFLEIRISGLKKAAAAARAPGGSGTAVPAGYSQAEEAGSQDPADQFPLSRSMRQRVVLPIPRRRAVSA